MKHVFLPYLSDKMPKVVAPKNLPIETAVATVVRQKLLSQIKSHYKKLHFANDIIKMRSVFVKKSIRKKREEKFQNINLLQGQWKCRVLVHNDMKNSDYQNTKSFQAMDVIVYKKKHPYNSLHSIVYNSNFALYSHHQGHHFY